MLSSRIVVTCDHLKISKVYVKLRSQNLLISHPHITPPILFDHHKIKLVVFLIPFWNVKRKTESNKQKKKTLFVFHKGLPPDFARHKS